VEHRFPVRNAKCLSILILYEWNSVRFIRTTLGLAEELVEGLERGVEAWFRGAAGDSVPEVLETVANQGFNQEESQEIPSEGPSGELRV